MTQKLIRAQGQKVHIEKKGKERWALCGVWCRDTGDDPITEAVDLAEYCQTCKLLAYMAARKETAK